jgi:hypothetical protein
VVILRKWLQDAMLAAHGEGAVACGGKHPVFCKLVPEIAEAWSIPNSSEFIAIRIDREGGTLGTHHLCVLRLDEGHLGISNSGI